MRHEMRHGKIAAISNQISRMVILSTIITLVSPIPLYLVTRYHYENEEKGKERDVEIDTTS